MPDSWFHDEDQTTRIPIITEDMRVRPEPHEHDIPEHRHDKVAIGDGIGIAGIWLSSSLLSIWLSKLIFVEWHKAWHLDFNTYPAWGAIGLAALLVFTPILAAMRTTDRIQKR